MEIYMDDGLLFHADFQQPLILLRQVFEKLREANLRINPKKSVFARKSLIFLEFLFTPEGIKVDPKRFEKIRNIQPPKNPKELRQILGFFQYFRRFKGFAQITNHLRQLLTKDTKFVWTEQHGLAMAQLKESLLNNATLVFPNMQEPFMIRVDASHPGIGHALLQMHDSVEEVVAFGGRAMKKHEVNLSATDSELLAILHAIETYHPFISNGRKFTIKTDRCSSQYLRNLQNAKSPKLIRPSMILQTTILILFGSAENRMC
jgi:hypothetical protein